MNPLESPDTYKIKRANEWIAGSRKRKRPKMLFGEFWLEGELSILFADTGMGKSVLAVQIADSIARGVPIKPLRLTAKPQKVAYFDYELDEKQFEMRYSADASDDQDFLHRPYRFSNKFYRAEIDIEADPSPDFATTEAYLRSGLRRGIERTGAKVVIIDNITYLRGPTDTARTCIPLMREFRRLKKELGLSILLLAHTPKRDTARRITVNDLQGSKVMSNFADNIFAIGQSGIDTGIRYVKHIKQRSTTLLYDASYVPAFEICKRGGNFLEFRFRTFGEEDRHLSSSIRSIRMERAEVVAAMSEDGMSQRAIAAELGISAASVNRYLHMAKSVTGEVEEEAYNEDFYGEADEKEDAPPEETEENPPWWWNPEKYPWQRGRHWSDEIAATNRERYGFDNNNSNKTCVARKNDEFDEGDDDPDDVDEGREDEEDDEYVEPDRSEPGTVVTGFPHELSELEDEPNELSESDLSEPGTVVTGYPDELSELDEPNELNKLTVKYKTMDDKIEVGDIVLDRNGQLKKRTIYGWDLCADALE